MKTRVAIIQAGDLFRLMDAAASRPENHKGEKVEVKGLLMRQADATVLNVTSVQTSGSACPE